ncbi:MAG: tetratricopeptide repeat protein [Myxococcales bacterium]
MISVAQRFVGCLVKRVPTTRIQGISRTRGGVFALVVLAGMLFGSRAEAQLNPMQKQEMKQHYEKATRAYDVQKYSEAVDEYQKAYEIGGDPAMLYNVAQSYRLADQLSEALRFYRRYLQRSPNARNREDVERKIFDLEKTIEERRRAAAAVPAGPVAPPPVVVVAPPPAPLASHDEGTSGTLVAGIIVASVGAAALATAAITGKMSINKGDEVSTASNNHGTFDPNVEKTGKTLEKVAVISAIGGGVAAIAGVVLIIVSQTGSSETGQHASLLPVIAPGIMGAVATVRF